MAFKKFRKWAKKRVWKPYSQIKGGRGRKNRTKLWDELAKIKKVVNAEKKRIQTGSSGTLVGQVNNNSNGFYGADLTPIPSTGTGYGQRTGASIKLTSTYLTFQFVQQSSTVSPIRGCIYVYKVLGAPTATPATYPVQMYNANPFISGASIVEYNSALNPDYFGRQQLVRKKYFKIESDNVSQVVYKTVNLGIKYGKGHHVRFDKDSNTVLAGQLVIFILFDGGNCNTTTASTLSGIPYTAANTGLTMNLNLSHYFYDN